MKCAGCKQPIDYMRTPPMAVGEGEFVHDSECKRKYYRKLNKQIKASFEKSNKTESPQ